MKAYLPSLENLGEKIIASLGIIALLGLLYPEVTYALSQSNQAALVFEIDSNKKDGLYSNLTLQKRLEQEELIAEVIKFIQKKAPRSPLANYDTVKHIVTQNGTTGGQDAWIRALSISFVESHMCTYTPKKNGVESHNCSGIVAGKSGYKMYASYEDWFTDLTKLLQKPSYINRPIHKYLQFYVQPGSMSWLNGVKNSESKLTEIRDNLGKPKHVAFAKVSYNPVQISEYSITN